MTFVVSPRSIAVGICAGLASSLLVLSPVGGSMLAVPLTLLVQLPLVMAVLGWGTAGALVGAAVGTATLLAVSPSTALYFALFFVPVAVLGAHLVGLARPGNPVVGAPGDPRAVNTRPVEWFPLGQILAVIAMLVVVGAILICVLLQTDPSAITSDEIKTVAQDYVKELGQVDPAVTPDQMVEMFIPIIATMMRILPFAFTMSGTVVGILNLELGIWISEKSGNLLRPREDLAAFDLPRAVAPVFVVALVAAFIGGIPGAIAAAIAGASAGLLLISGLAVLHTITRRLSFRLPLLVLVYLFLGLCAVPLVIVGILEPYTRFRQRISPRGPANPSS